MVKTILVVCISWNIHLVYHDFRIMTSEGVQPFRVPNSGWNPKQTNTESLLGNDLGSTQWVQTNVTVCNLFPRCWIYPHCIVLPKYSNHQSTRKVFLGRSLVTEQKPVRLCLIEIPGKSLAWHLAEVRLEDEALWCTSTTSISPDRQKVFPTSTTQGSKEQQQSINAANVLLTSWS